MFQTGSPGIEIRRYYEMKIENLFLSQSRPRGGRNPRPASASVRFEQKFIGPPSKSVLEADELPRPASASVRLRQKVVGPPSASVLEADGVEENLPSVVFHRPASASVLGRPSPSRDPWSTVRLDKGQNIFWIDFFCNFPIVDYLLVANSHWKEMIMIPF